jgi:ABC-type transport system substrate-binding protein
MRNRELMRLMLSAGLVAATALAAEVSVPTTGLAADDTALSNCPARKPVLRLATQTGQALYSTHPAEARFGATHYTRLHQSPLFGANPLETGIDASYGVIESWKYLPGAKGMILKVRKGLTFNDGSPITPEDVVFSLNLSKSKFADSQINGTLKRIGIEPKVIDANTVQLDFKKGNATFNLEMSPLVFPLYVTSKKYHSNGEISQAAVDRFRSKPLAAGPYRVIDRQAERFLTLVAARKDPLLGCPVYDRIEFRSVTETGTRMNQFRTGQVDIISGARDLVKQAKKIGATILSKPDANTIGLYIFQADYPGNVFANRDVRLAANYAIDHKLIGETIFSGVGIRPWGCTWPPATEISTTNPRYLKACQTPRPYDPERAKKHLAAAGYKPGKGPTINIEYSASYPEEGALAEAMQPMLKAVGFNAKVERVDRAERNRRRWSGKHINTLLFFGPGGRLTSLAGANSVWGPTRGWGPKNDKGILAAINRASAADTIKEYTEGMADLGEVIYKEGYGPGWFSAGAIYFVRKEIGDWGLGKSKGRGPMNLSALVTKR